MENGYAVYSKTPECRGGSAVYLASLRSCQPQNVRHLLQCDRYLQKNVEPFPALLKRRQSITLFHTRLRVHAWYGTRVARAGMNSNQRTRPVQSPIRLRHDYSTGRDVAEQMPPLRAYAYALCQKFRQGGFASRLWGATSYAYSALQIS